MYSRILERNLLFSSVQFSVTICLYLVLLTEQPVITGLNCEPPKEIKLK